MLTTLLTHTFAMCRTDIELITFNKYNTMKNLINSAINNDTNEMQTLQPGQVCLMYLVKTSSDTKVKAVFCENVDKSLTRKNLTAEQIATHFKSNSVGNAFTSKYNASDSRFSQSLQYCNAGIEFDDLVAGLGLDITWDDFSDDSELALELGKSALPLYILNPTDVDNNTQLRIVCTEDTEPQVNKAGESYDLDNLDRVVDGVLKSSAKQNGKGGDIITHNGKPIFMRRNICFANNVNDVPHLTLLPDVQLQSKSSVAVDVEQVETVSDALSSL